MQDLSVPDPHVITTCGQGRQSTKADVSSYNSMQKVTSTSKCIVFMHDGHATQQGRTTYTFSLHGPLNHAFIKIKGTTRFRQNTRPPDHIPSGSAELRPPDHQTLSRAAPPSSDHQTTRPRPEQLRRAPTTSTTRLHRNDDRREERRYDNRYHSHDDRSKSSRTGQLHRHRSDFYQR